MRTALLLVTMFSLLGCSPAVDPPMTRSCCGEYVNECRPYDYARVTAASLTPDGITLNDPAMRATVHVEFERCGMATLPLYVQISVFVGGTGDASIPEPDGGSTSARVIPLGMVGPAASGATSIDAVIDNPFFANVPANTRVTLQFAPMIDDCQGQIFETAYRTGPVVTPMP